MSGWLKVGGRWIEVPGWARWMAQDLDGGWYFFKEKPLTGPISWFVSNNRVSYVCTTPVIGDWREQLYEVIWSDK